MSEENKAISRRFMEELNNRGNLAVIDELLAEDFLDRSLLPGQESDREGYKRSVADARAASSDVHWTIEDQIAEGDKVATRITSRFTRSGKEERWVGMVFHRLSGGKIVEEWTLAHRLDETGHLEGGFPETSRSEEAGPT